MRFALAFLVPLGAGCGTGGRAAPGRFLIRRGENKTEINDYLVGCFNPSEKY